jgi:hypothetical protein
MTVLERGGFYVYASRVLLSKKGRHSTRHASLVKLAVLQIQYRRELYGYTIGILRKPAAPMILRAATPPAPICA